MTWHIARVAGSELDIGEVLAIYRSSGLGERRPVADAERMAAMIRNANLIVTCRVAGEMVGIANADMTFANISSWE